MTFYTAEVDGDLEQMARNIERSPDYRLLRRLPLMEELWLSSSPTQPMCRLAIIDSETTGLSDTDKLIEVSIVRLALDYQGQLSDIEAPISQLEDPLVPLTPQVTAITGLTDDVVAGQRFDDAAIMKALADVDAIVAHNARFDAAFWHRRFGCPVKPWICSLRDMDWRDQGATELSLSTLLAQRGHFYRAHRAAADAWAAAMLLAMPGADGRTLAATLFERGQRRTYRVQAQGAPYDMRHVLRARRYRWDAAKRAWSIDIEEDALIDEQAWLCALSPAITPMVTETDWFSRHLA